jgi:hypothetical protein
MPEPVPNPQLLQALGQLARGLSALFWGLPLALILCFQTARTDWLGAFGVLPPLLTTGLLLHGVLQMRHFRQQEHDWRRALERAQLLALVNVGLSPFLFWWSQAPGQPLFNCAVGLLAVSGLVFLSHLNLVLRRLGALLPDETLRHETTQFTNLNRGLLTVTTLLAALLIGALWWRRPLPLALAYTVAMAEHFGLWLLVFFVLLPLAMTMALLWKTKEVILGSVFGGTR